MSETLATKELNRIKSLSSFEVKSLYGHTYSLPLSDGEQDSKVHQYVFADNSCLSLFCKTKIAIAYQGDGTPVACSTLFDISKNKAA